jgi:hypothetical protein
MKSEKDIKRIFSDKSAFRREVALAAVQIEGLGDEELAGALAYEVEPFSSVPAAEAEVAWKEVAAPDPSVRVFDVAVIRRTAKKRCDALSRLFVPAVVLGAVILAAAGADYLHLRRKAGQIEESLAVRSPLQQELSSLSRRAGEANRRAQEIRARRESAAKAQDECARLRRAYLDFFESLSVIGGKAVVKSVSPGDGPFTLSFVMAAADERSGGAALAALNGELARRGWTLEPGDMSGSGGGAMAVFNVKARFAR